MKKPDFFALNLGGFFLLTLCTASALWFRDNPAFRSWHLNPFLIPILLTGLFAGWREALILAAAAGTAYACLIARSEIPFSRLRFEPDGIHIASFLLAGWIFGQAGSLFRMILWETQKQLSSAREELRRLWEENQSLRREAENLRRVAGNQDRSAAETFFPDRRVLVRRRRETSTVMGGRF
jgi:hypothetical protein